MDPSVLALNSAVGAFNLVFEDGFSLLSPHNIQLPFWNSVSLPPCRISCNPLALMPHRPPPPALARFSRSVESRRSSRTCCNDLLHQKPCLWAEEIYRPTPDIATITALYPYRDLHSEIPCRERRRKLIFSREES